MSLEGTQQQQQQQQQDFDEEWEEWDGVSPFWVHCVAGSLAGVAEHVLVYPLDTVRTHIQVCAACHYNPELHNASTQAQAQIQAQAAMKTASSPNANNTMITKNYSSGSKTNNIPGSVLQKAVMSATTSTTTTTTGGGAGAAAQSVVGRAAATNNNNLSMLQAIRQLISHPLSIETAAAGSSSAAGVIGIDAAAATPAAVNTAAVKPPPGMQRLWRGVHTILIGCIPAHALYFSTYEIVKAATLDTNGNVTGYGSALAGGAAVISHDLVLGPLDTVKQRLQLGHYHSLSHAVTTMIRNEGAISLLRSFPITLATNIPYGMIMVGTNEFLKQQWTATSGDNNTTGELTLGVTLGASSLAGLVAAATTTPLDRIKTYLQTQQLAPKCLLSQQGVQLSPENCPIQAAANNHNHIGGGSSASSTMTKPFVADWKQAAIRIYRTEGLAGFFRGVTPRILSHTPAVAISWTTYEWAKTYLQHAFVES